MRLKQHWLRNLRVELSEKKFKKYIISSVTWTETKGKPLGVYVTCFHYDVYACSYLKLKRVFYVKPRFKEVPRNVGNLEMSI